MSRVLFLFQSFFSKRSAVDGRLVLFIFLAVYFLSIYFASFFMDYHIFWRALGVSTLERLFDDINAVTTAMNCEHLGYNVYEYTPCYHTLFPTFAYPPIWFLFSCFHFPRNFSFLIFVSVVCVNQFSICCFKFSNI